MPYNVIQSFRDKDDKNKHYTKNKDTYPREGLVLSKERIAVLLGDNEFNAAFIAETDTKDTDASLNEASSEDIAVNSENTEEVDASIDAAVTEESPEVEEDALDIEALTKDEIRAELDTLGVEYVTRDTKDELIEKLRAAVLAED